MTTTRHQDDQRPAKSSPFDAKTAHKNRTVQTPMQASAQRVRAFQQRQKFNFLADRQEEK